jgi:hypothetical protein
LTPSRQPSKVARVDPTPPQNKKLRLAIIIGCGVLALLLVGVIFAVGSFYLLKTINNRPRGAGPLIKSTNESCQITFPAGWSSVKQLNADAVISAGDLVNIEYFIVICDRKDRVTKDFNQYADGVADAMVPRLQKASRSPATSLKVNGKMAARYRIDGSFNDRDYSYFLTCVDGDKYRYQLLGWTFKDQSAKASATFDAISQSWTEMSGG